MKPNFTMTFPIEVAHSDVLEELTEITLAELCRACGTQENIVIELINQGVMEGSSIHPEQSSTHWKFTGIHLRQVKIATRLQRDLGINLAGAALALQLIEEIDFLHKQLSRISS